MSATVDHLISELDHPLADTRRAAADALVALGEPAALALCEAFPKASDPKVRRRIFLVLEALRVPKTIPDLLHFVTTTEGVRGDDTRALALRAVVNALEPKHRRQVFDAFINLRRDVDPTVRIVALDGLVALRDPRAQRFLEEMATNEPDTMVKNAAMGALNRFRPLCLDEGRPGPDTYTPQDLSIKLASTDAFQRSLAIDLLLEHAQRFNAFAVFSEAAHAPHALARQSGLQGLGALGDVRAYPLLLQVLERSSDAQELALALRSLARFQPPTHLDLPTLARQIGRLTGHASALVASAACAALASVPHPQARQRLEELRTHPDPLLSESAREAYLDHRSRFANL